MPFPYRKLVRDRIPEIIQADGRHTVTRVLDEAAYRQALLDKLVEEAGEAACASTADLPGELADVLEMLRALTAAAGMSWETLLTLADDKAQPPRRLRRQDLPRISRIRQQPSSPEPQANQPNGRTRGLSSPRPNRCQTSDRTP
jgi:predicted house-cleaning noncanonical NTP pyrophosphatase (MazG superfamily)